MLTFNRQEEAELSHVYMGIVSELGGLAHDRMTVLALDRVIDNMLSKGIPTNPSAHMLRWIHRRRKLNEYKIAQILGAQVATKESIIPECFGKFNDPDAVECRHCLDATLCSMKMKSRAQGLPDNAVVQQQYALGPKPNFVTIQQILTQKYGQISKNLVNGAKVVLEVAGGNLRVSSVDANKSEQKGEDTNMANKPKKGAAPVEEEELDLETGGGTEEELDLTLADQAEEEQVEEEEEAAPVAAAPKAAAPAKKGAAAPAKAAPAAEPAAKPAKAAKPKPQLNERQTQFKAKLDSLQGEEKWKYSKQIATSLKLPVGDKTDERINHMTRVMAIQKKLGEMPAAAKAAPAKK